MLPLLAMRPSAKLLAFTASFLATGCDRCTPGPAPPSADEVSTARSSTEPAITLDARSRPIVGWLTGVVGGNNIVQARRLDKGTWYDLPGLGDPKEHNGPVDVAMGQGDEPIAAWAAGKVPSVIRVAAWTGAAWSELVGADDRVGRSLLPRILSAPGGRVIVAWWFLLGAGAELRIRQWDGKAWSSLPSPALGPTLDINRGAPDLLLDASGAVVAAWSAETPGGASVFVARWDGASWVPYGTSLAGGGVSAEAGDSIRPRLALGPAGPMVAWVHALSRRRSVHVRRWTGTVWAELAGSATGKGLSRADVTTVALAADKAGQPIVAWGEGDEDAQDVFLQAWTGTAWKAPGSFGGERLSAPGTFSVLPAIAVTPLRACVAWALYNGDRVVARCEAAW